MGTLQRIKFQSIKNTLFILIAILVGGGLGFLLNRNHQPARCNIATVKLFGDVVYYSNESSSANQGGKGDGSLDQVAAENVRQQIEAADANSDIKGILFQVDSFGGDPVAGEEIAAALKHVSKPNVALIADQGTSAAYWASTGAQTIFASANSNVGSIGVTQSYLDQTEQNTKNGLNFVPLTAGEYKDMGNPNRPLTPAEEAILQRDLDIMRQNFINAVAQNRNLSVTSVTVLADGSSMLGQAALQKGLIDKIGDIYDAENYLAGKIGGEPTLCE